MTVPPRVDEPGPTSEPLESTQSSGGFVKPDIIPPPTIGKRGKPNYIPIFPPGFHPIGAAEVELYFVHHFRPECPKREEIAARLLTFIKHLSSAGLPGDLWLDGSFTTWKPNPEDADVLFVFDAAEADSMPRERKAILAALLNRNESRIRYQLDVLSVDVADENMLSYWRGWFGFDDQNRPKGIPVIRIGQ